MREGRFSWTRRAGLALDAMSSLDRTDIARRAVLRVYLQRRVSRVMHSWARRRG